MDGAGPRDLGSPGQHGRREAAEAAAGGSGGPRGPQGRSQVQWGTDLMQARVLNMIRGHFLLALDLHTDVQPDGA